MLAFALWDGRDRLVLLARDPFGIKPLYYAADQGQFRFASQVKALLSGGVDGQISPAGVVSFLTWGLRDRAPHLVSINQSLSLLAQPWYSMRTDERSRRLTTIRYRPYAAMCRRRPQGGPCEMRFSIAFTIISWPMCPSAG